MLPVQVIGQQWEFTYRYPTYGGVETPSSCCRSAREIEFHVTSLDAIHSFWAYELGVKADANPGVDNIVVRQAEEAADVPDPLRRAVRLWHGYMFDTGQVVTARSSPPGSQQQRVLRAIARYLPPYALTYAPGPAGRRIARADQAASGASSASTC